MPHYHTLGSIPKKRHTQFRKPDGSLYSEQLVSTEGFSDVYSLTYHLYPPTRVIRIDDPIDVKPAIAINNNMQHRSFLGFNIKPGSDYLESRTPVLVNNDLYISLAAPSKGTDKYFFKNSQATEMLFIHEGSGTLHTMYGSLTFSYGDHIIIPRGVIYKIDFDSEDNRLLIVESFSPIRIPRKYLNKFGQLEEHAPYCERDIRIPMKLETFDEKGDFLVMIKKNDQIFPYHYANHPFDVVGWDVTIIPIFSPFMILNQLLAASINRHLYIKALS